MKQSINKGIKFIRQNPTIIYSLFLIVAVSVIIFLNTYYSVIKFQENNDTLLHSKAILSEDILNLAILNDLDNPSEIEKLIQKIKEKDSEILEITILQPSDNKEKFSVIASTDKEKINKKTVDDINFIAWYHPEGVARLQSGPMGRYWEVSKIIGDIKNKKGLIVFDLSLKDSDMLINQTIQRMYWVTILSLLVVLLLIANHTRLFKYILKAAKLEEVDRMKDDFISMASHELRMPLTIINGYAEMLEDSLNKKQEDKKQAEYQERIHQLKNIKIASKRLSELVNDILDVSRIEQGKLTIKTEKININNLIQEVLEQFAIKANEKNLKLEFDEKQNQLWVKADPKKVKQILINLVGNAIKYTQQGKVSILTEESKNFVKIIVKDTGIGMSAQAMKNLFSKFYRIKNDKTEGISGTGLGLWISRELARKMKGDLEVESMEGVGSQFILKLPKIKE